MAIGSPQWMYKSGEAYTIDQSLRFNDDDKADLTRTPTSAGNRKTSTFSAWVKKGNEVNGMFFLAYGADNNLGWNGLMFSGNQLTLSGWTFDWLKSTAVFRDPTAWYHIVLAINTTLSTANDRIKLYVNGTQLTDFATRNNPSQNDDFAIGNSVTHTIGSRSSLDAAQCFDGYLAEVNFIDGQALTPADFGETGDYGEWKPKEYSGTYGTNGFYLPFKNDYTVEGFSTVTYKGTGATQYIGGTGFNPDLVWVKRRDSSAWHILSDSVRGTGKSLYSNDTAVEGDDGSVTLAAFNTDGFTIGSSGAMNTSGASMVSWNWDMGVSNPAHFVTPTSAQHSTTQSKIGASSIAFDGTNDLLTIPHHTDFDLGEEFTIEAWVRLDNLSNSSVIVGKGTHTTAVGEWLFLWNGSNGPRFRFMQSGSYVIDVKEGSNSGYSTGVWYHISVVKTSNYLKIYTDGVEVASTNYSNISVTADSNKDLILGYASTFVTYFDGYLDEIRISNTARYTSSFTPSTSAFSGDSSTLLLIQSDTSDGSTTFADTRGTPLNTNGSITSRVKANTTYGQSIVSYTGNGSDGATVGHGLSSAPDMVIVKDRDGTPSWSVGHAGLGTNEVLLLNSDSAKANCTTDYSGGGVGARGSSHFTLEAGTSNANNVNNSGNKYIAYCFHSVTGYSKFGSYTGNADTSSGKAVTTGFKPAFLMIKRTDGTGSWAMFDSVRSTVDSRKLRLNADESVVEASFSYGVNFDSTGFTIMDDSGGINGNGSEYIYMAFADKREYAYWLDQSGNNNDWTSNNLTESDISVDSPTNNFATLNPLALGADGTLSEGNLKLIYGTSGTRTTTTATMGVSSGKWYWEVVVNHNGGELIGITNISDYTGTYPGQASGSWGYYSDDGQKYVEGTASNYGSGYTAGDIISFALDMDNGTLVAYKNNSSQGTLVSSLTGDIYPAIGDGGGGGTTNNVFNFGQDSSFAGNKTAQGNQDSNDIGDFYYTPPTGFLALCTKNLPDVAVTPSEHFNTVLYTGDGNASRTITGAGFAPDLLWGKIRSTTNNHFWFDTLRGANRLISNSTGAESDYSTWFSTLTSDGFTTGTTNANSMNQNNATFVAWFWKANGSGSSNTNGTITSTVSANVDAGFSIVSYTGNATSGATVGHGLSSAPDMMIVKRRDGTGQWEVYHSGNTSEPETEHLRLSGTAATSDNANYWNDTAPTSSVFTVGTDGYVNASSGTYVAYCFHSVDGYSKVGSYTGNGNADGTFVYTGFRPAYVMIKRTDDAVSWIINDSTRDVHNATTSNLYADLSDAEDSGVERFDFVSNGFKLRATSGAFNGNGNNFIYIAFAETPFKYSNAR